MYTGIVHENGRHEYYFGNDTEEAAELREVAAVQLGMLVRVLADRSDNPAEEIADLAVERAEQMELRRALDNRISWPNPLGYRDHTPFRATDHNM